MEATWPGCSLKLDARALVIEPAGGAPASIPLPALVGFTIVNTRRSAPGRAAASTPDADLVVAWREGNALRTTRVAVPREGLQLRLFLERLSQLRPEADLRGVSERDALRRLGLEAPARRPLAAIVIIALATAAAVIVAALLAK